MSKQANIRMMYDKLLPQVSASYFELFYYVITMFVCLYFVVVLLSSLKNTYLTYYDDINIPWDKVSKFEFKPIDNLFDNKGGDDDYSLQEDNHENMMELIKESLDKNNTLLSDTFQPILDFKKENNMKHNLNTTIDTTTFGEISDDYVFESKKNTPFFQMLFEKPKHYPLVNNSPQLDIN